MAAVPVPASAGGSNGGNLRQVPGTLELRERIRAEAAAYGATLDRRRPVSRAGLEQRGRELLGRLDLPEEHLGFAMVMIGNAFWKDQFAAVPFDRRLLLLPHCAKPSDSCPAEYDDLGLNCIACGACPISDLKAQAESLGYKVRVADGTPIALKTIVSGQADGLLGVACLNVLERAFEKILLAGLPAYAVPLHNGNCKDSTLDEAWVYEVLDLYVPDPAVRTRSYVPLLRVAERLFTRDFERLVPRRPVRDGAAEDLLVGTEAIALDFLARGGKRLRPFITLAAYDARRGAPATLCAAPEAIEFDYAVRRVAVAIEAFHKASLVHDDIEDDDEYRYGRPTLHRRYGVPTAINVGDYLLGLGYRLVSGEREVLGGEVVADILDRFADAHVRLSEGQGAELLWRGRRTRELRPLDALSIYALKTAPAFEAALHAGLRLAGSADEYEPVIRTFSRSIGVAFQILNDLDDWSPDVRNKRRPGRDVLAMRPTLLLALALEAAPTAQRPELLALVAAEDRDDAAVARVGQIYAECGAFAQARRLVAKYRARAREVAAEVQPVELRELLEFLVETVLADSGSEPSGGGYGTGLPIVSPA